MRALVALPTLLAVLFWAPAAPAATPFTVGLGSDPDVAVGFDGSAHVVWTSGGANAQVGYCRVDPMTEACGRTELLGFPGASDANSSGRATVSVPSPGKVVVVSGCWNCPGTPAASTNKAFRWVSTDNGSSFGVTQIGREFELNGAGAWIDEANLFVAANSNRAMAQTMPTLVGAGVSVAPAGYFFDGEVVRVPGTGLLVGASNDLARIGYRAYDGALSAGGINNFANWSAIGEIGSAAETASESSLNAGGGGAAIVYRSQQSGTVRLALRSFDPGTETFGSPHYIQGDNPIDAALRQPDSFQDPPGRLFVVWKVPAGGGQLRYRAGLANGTGFGAVGTLAAGETFTEPEIGVGNETGFVVWTEGGAVRAVLVDPRYDPPASPSSPSSPDPGEPPEPAVSGATIGKRALRPGEGTTFRFTSSVAGQAVLTIEKRFKGLKAKRRGRPTCLPRTKRRLRALRRRAATPRAYRKLLRKRTCRAYRRIGEIRQDVRAGANTIAFDGRVAGRALGRGSYRATLVVTDPTGDRSRAETLAFEVVGKTRSARPARSGRPRAVR